MVLLRTARRRFFSSEGMGTSAHRRVAPSVPRYVLTNATQGAHRRCASRSARGSREEGSRRGNRRAGRRSAGTRSRMVPRSYNLASSFIIDRCGTRSLSIQPAAPGRVAGGVGYPRGHGAASRCSPRSPLRRSRGNAVTVGRIARGLRRARRRRPRLGPARRPRRRRSRRRSRRYRTGAPARLPRPPGRAARPRPGAPAGGAARGHADRHRRQPRPLRCRRRGDRATGPRGGVRGDGVPRIDRRARRRGRCPTLRSRLRRGAAVGAAGRRRAVRSAGALAPACRPRPVRLRRPGSGR